MNGRSCRRSWRQRSTLLMRRRLLMLMLMRRRLLMLAMRGWLRQHRAMPKLPAALLPLRVMLQQSKIALRKLRLPTATRISRIS